jgi:hypothetical protein
VGPSGQRRPSTGLRLPGPALRSAADPRQHGWGIGDLRSDSLIAARRHAGWVLIEEHAEGDQLFRVRSQSPEFLDGFVRVSEGGGVALYQPVEPSGPIGVTAGAVVTGAEQP